MNQLALQKVLQLLGGASKFVAPRAKAAVDAGINTAGMAKDYFDYSTARSQEEKNRQAQSYTARRNVANEAMKQFGFDINKKDNQFDPKQYTQGVIGGAGEVATLASPVKGGFAARSAINSIPGVSDAISKGKGFSDIALEGALTSVLGTQGEKVVKLGGNAIKAIGGKIADTGENLGLRKFGLTKLDINKLNKILGQKTTDFLKESGLIGKSAEDISSVIDPKQSAFNEIAENSDLKIDENELFNRFTSKIDELRNSNAPELKAKAQQLEEYVTNLFENKTQDFSAKGLTNERRIIDQLVKDFQNSGDAVGASKNRVVRDVIQDAIVDQSEKQGMNAGGKTLKELGTDLNKLYSFEDIASKRAPQQTGLPAGLLRVITGSGGASIGAGLGGLPGAIIGGVGGLALESVANNPNVLKKIATVAPKVGENLVEKGSNIAGSEGLQKLMQQLGIKSGQVISSLTPPSIQVESSENQNTQNSQNNAQVSNLNANTSIIPQPAVNGNPSDLVSQGYQLSKDGEYYHNPQTGDAISADGQWKFDTKVNDWVENPQAQTQTTPNESPISEEQFQQLILADLVQNGGKNINTIAAAKKLLLPEEKKDKPLSAQSQKDQTKAHTGLSSLDRITSDIERDPNVLAKKYNPFDQSGRQIGADMASVIDIIGYFRTGATLTPQQRKDYIYMFPSALDDAETRKRKLDAIRLELQGYSKIGEPAIGGGTDDVSMLLQSLGMTQ